MTALSAERRGTLLVSGPHIKNSDIKCGNCQWNNSRWEWFRYRMTEQHIILRYNQNTEVCLLAGRPLGRECNRTHNQLRWQTIPRDNFRENLSNQRYCRWNKCMMHYSLKNSFVCKKAFHILSPYPLPLLASYVIMFTKNRIIIFNKMSSNNWGKKCALSLKIFHRRGICNRYQKRLSVDVFLCCFFSLLPVVLSPPPAVRAPGISRRLHDVLCDPLA